MRSSARSAVMRRIVRGWRDGTPELQGAAPPTQRQPAPADQTELVICDQTIDEHHIGLKPIVRKVWTLDGTARWRRSSTVTPGGTWWASCTQPRAARCST